MDYHALIISLFFALGCAPLAFFFPGCLCCPAGCTIASDNFAADDLATNWDIRSGSPTISGGLLNAGAGTNLLIHNTAADAGATGVFTSVVVRCTSTTDTLRLVAAYVDDNNYWYAEAQAGVSNGTLKIFERVAGVDTQRGSTGTVTSFQVNEDWELRLCLQPGAVVASMFTGGSALSAQEVIYAATVTVASTKAGVGGSEVGTVTFNDFAFEKHKVDSSTCKTCLSCSTCSTGQPYQVQVVISGIVDTFLCPACLNGTWILTRLNRCQWEITPICGGRRFFLWFSTATNLQLIESTTGFVNWNATVTNPTDCMAWDGLVLNTGVTCPGSTATITAIS